MRRLERVGVVWMTRRRARTFRVDVWRWVSRGSRGSGGSEDLWSPRERAALAAASGKVRFG